MGDTPLTDATIYEAVRGYCYSRLTSYEDRLAVIETYGHIEDWDTSQVRACAPAGNMLLLSRTFACT